MAKLIRVRLPTLILSVSLFASNLAHGEMLGASEAAKLYPEETTYSIFRKGKNIGKHSVIINSVDNRVAVSVDSQIIVRILKIPVFKFRYLSNELWTDNRLVKVDSTTTTDQEIEKASLYNKDNQSLLSYNGKRSTTELIDYPTNHWNISAVEQTHLFNTVKGVKSDVSVVFIGNETLMIGDQTLSTKHYAYSGDIVAETWYDENNRWVKLAFLGSDGNQIIYLIDNP